MGVSYNVVGGVGIKITEDIIDTLIDNGAFSEEDWEEYGNECVDEFFDYECKTAGNACFGETTQYLLIEGDTLADVNSNSANFIKKLNKKGLKITKEDLIIISEHYIY